jgi:hypothetical protein
MLNAKPKALLQDMMLAQASSTSPLNQMALDAAQHVEGKLLTVNQINCKLL